MSKMAAFRVIDMSSTIPSPLWPYHHCFSPCFPLLYSWQILYIITLREASAFALKMAPFWCQTEGIIFCTALVGTIHRPEIRSFSTNSWWNNLHTSVHFFCDLCMDACAQNTVVWVLNGCADAASLATKVLVFRGGKILAQKTIMYCRPRVER